MKLLLSSLTAISLIAAMAPAPLKAEEKEAPKTYTIGLSMYSLRQLFQNGKLDALDYPEFAKKTFGITEIDVWDGGFPADKRTDMEYYKELKKRSDAAGTNIFLVMTGAVDANGKTADERKLAGMKFSLAVDQAVVLGSDFVRVFLLAPDLERDVAITNSIEALAPLADYAKSKGIIILIEPGSSKWSKQGPFLADLAKKMDHPALKLMPDFGKMQYDDPYGGTVAMMPFSISISAKSYNFDKDGNETTLDYTRLMKSVNDTNYKGIVAIEYEGEKLGPVEGVKATQKLLQRFQTETK
jgi:sugar phosphate isomerase/epimerase